MRKPRILMPLMTSVPVVFAGCAEEGVAPYEGPAIEINVAPLTLPGITDACYGVTVTNGPAGTGDTVWSRTGSSALCADRFGDGIGSISYVGPCDADTGINSVTLVLESLSDASGTLTPGTHYKNPCANPGDCRLDVNCQENADTPVTFNLTIMRPANQGFFDIAVNFNNIFCSAKFDCQYENGSPINLLHHTVTQERGSTVVLGVACTAGPGLDTHLYMSHLDITCERAGTSEFVSFYVDPVDGPGNVTSGPQSSSPTIPNELLFQAAIYEGQEFLQSGGQNLGKRYWNIAMGIIQGANKDSGAAGALGRSGTLRNCKVHVHATAHDGAMADPVLGAGTTPDGTYPFIHLYDLPLNTTGELSCTRHALDGPGGFLYSDYTLPGHPYFFPHELRLVGSGDVVTEHLARPVDDTWLEPNNRGSIAHREVDIVQDSLGRFPVGDTVDWFVFWLPQPSLLRTVIYPNFQQPNPLWPGFGPNQYEALTTAAVPADILSYQVYFHPPACGQFNCLVPVVGASNSAARDNSNFLFTNTPGQPAGRYLVRVQREAAPLPPVHPTSPPGFRYTLRVRAQP